MVYTGLGERDKQTERDEMVKTSGKMSGFEIY